MKTGTFLYLQKLIVSPYLLTFDQLNVQQACGIFKILKLLERCKSADAALVAKIRVHLADPLVL